MQVVCEHMHGANRAPSLEMHRAAWALSVLHEPDTRLGGS